MKQYVLTQFPWPWLPTTALVIFFLLFIGLSVRVSLRSRRRVFLAAEVLPLTDGEPHE